MQAADLSRCDTSNTELFAIERTWTAVFPTIQLESQCSMEPNSIQEQIALEPLPTRDVKDGGIVANPITHDVVSMQTKGSPNAKPFWARATQLVRRGRRKHEKLEEDETQACGPASTPGVVIDQVWIPIVRIETKFSDRQN